jgi:hypothetical protein
MKQIDSEIIMKENIIISYKNDEQKLKQWYNILLSILKRSLKQKESQWYDIFSV